MHSILEEKTSRFKLAQLYHFVNSTQITGQPWFIPNTRTTYSHNRIFNEILEDDFDFNCKVSIKHSQWPKSKSILRDCIALHFVYQEDATDIDAFTNLLERGADFTIKNEEGRTLLHSMITDYYEGIRPYMNAILSAHVKFQNFTNPRDNYGWSHLHAACVANHVEAVKLFLDNGIPIEEAVNQNASEFYRGFTPLHCAALNGQLEVIELLVSRGANINAQNANGESPLDLLVMELRRNFVLQINFNEQVQFVNLLMKNNAVSTIGLSNLHIALTFKDLSIAEKLLDEGADIDYAVPIESHYYSGNNALHFSLEHSLEAMIMLLKRGAKVDVENSLTMTPIDLCFDKYHFEGLCKIFSSIETWKEIRLSDGETRLLDLMTSMNDLDEFKQFLDDKMKDAHATVTNDFTVWSGYSILHFAIMFSKANGRDQERNEGIYETAIVQECLNRGLSVNVREKWGRRQTPIHIAFTKFKYNIVRLLLRRLREMTDVVDIVDEDNLSYLHIASAMGDVSLIEKLLPNSNVNIAYSGKKLRAGYVASGSTPLHAAILSKSHTVAETLLRHGADLHAKDVIGASPIHWLGIKNNNFNYDHRVAEVLFDALSSKPVNRVVEGLGLSYLHVACLLGNVKAAAKLLDHGSNIDTIITCEKRLSFSDRNFFKTDLVRYSTYTPLRMAIKRFNEEIINMLLHRGANMFVQVSSALIHDDPIDDRRVLRCFFQVLSERDDLQMGMQEKIGLTKLHIACYLKNEEAIRSLLDVGVDTNAQMHADAEIFAGCTPLHLLITVASARELPNLQNAEFTVGDMINLLLDHGADVTIANEEKDTPIHILYKHCRGFFDADRCKDLLLNAQKNFSVNPANAEGLSHLHLACYWQKVKIVEKFLQHPSVDVNCRIDCFAKNNAGSTPLHYILSTPLEPDDNWTELMQIVDLLLQHGADLTVKDVCGDTPLHKPAVLKSPQMCLLEKLVSYGGDMTIKNIRGQTPIDMYPDIHGENTNASEYVKFLQKYNYNINSWNRLIREGYIAKIFLWQNREDLCDNAEFKEFLKSSVIKTVDELGCTAIHNSVALPNDNDNARIVNYIYAIKSFIKKGIDINHQNHLGQTALHYGVQAENTIGVKALLTCGADFNIVDNTGNSPFSYAVENSEKKNNLKYIIAENVTIVLRFHIQKLQYLHLEVSELNRSLVERIQHFFEKPIRLEFERFVNLSQNFFDQVEITKTLKIGLNSLTLFNFFSEIGALTLYPILSKSERDKIDDFFELVKFQELYELTSIIQLQFRKMKERLELIDLALISLRTLLGFSVPNLCEQISRFLLNSDLKNLIKSTV